MDVPNLRNPEERDAWRNDVTCTDRAVAGDMWIPSFSKGNPDIPDEVYAEMKRRWREEFESDTGYTKMAFTQSSGKK